MSQQVPNDFDFASRIVDTGVVLMSGSQGSGVMLMEAPWAAPENAKLRINKISITEASGLPVTLLIWDQDTASSTPTSRGSGTVAGALIILTAGTVASSGYAITTTYTDAQLPSFVFEAGITCTTVGASGVRACSVTVEATKI